MRVRFWGTRGSIAAPGPGTNYFGGNTSCIEVAAGDGSTLILDCGTGARLLGDRMLANGNGPISATILLTHTHWDHIQGFPFFAPLFNPENHFQVYGPEGEHVSLRELLAGQMAHHYFPVELSQLSARVCYSNLGEGTHEIGALRVRAQRLNHTTPTLGYRIESSAGAICYLADHEPFFEGIWSDGQSTGRLDAIREAGDRRHATFMHGADIVIHEAQYTPEEYSGKHRWGHSSYAYVVQLAAATGVRRLFLTHHDPAHDDAMVRSIEERARELARQLNPALEVTCAFEGCEAIL